MGVHRGGSVSHLHVAVDSAACTRIIRRTAPSAATARRKRCGHPRGSWTSSRFDSAWIRSSSGCETCSRMATCSPRARSLHDVNFAECLRASADAIGWQEGRGGKGLCVLLKGMQTPSRASIAIEKEGAGYILRCATTEMGQGARHALSLTAARLLGVAPEHVRFPDPDTDLVPYDTRTTSSRSTHMMGRALEAAVADLHASGGARGLARSGTRVGSIPRRAKASVPRTGTREPLRPRFRRRGDRRCLGRPRARRRVRGLGRLACRSGLRTRGRSSWGSGPPCSSGWRSSTVR